MSGGGGVVRDCHGNFVFGYSEFFGTMSSLHAELRGLLVGIKHCMDRGFQQLHVEADSLTLIRIVQGDSACPWQLQRELDGSDSPADRLANYGVDSESRQVFTAFADLPRPS
ncbi:uncharacterized protein [Coffea arabica]|uniref:RNase H type-1 domain-containing protein n=1 Tax=Coffea arabica TaxID=13443 RepID=A0ABM4WPR6_COFAR